MPFLGGELSIPITNGEASSAMHSSRNARGLSQLAKISSVNGTIGIR